MYNEVTILSGPSGSGKSTFANLYQPKEEYVFSADKFFIKEGRYTFIPELLGKAHNECLKYFIKACQEKKSKGHEEIIIIDNTNCSMHEIAPYYRIAECLGFKPEILFFHTGITTCIVRTIHGVPDNVIERQKDNFLNLINTLPIHRQNIYHVTTINNRFDRETKCFSYLLKKHNISDDYENKEIINLYFK